MDDSSDLQSTQQLDQQRRKKRLYFYLLSGISAALVAINIIYGGSVACWAVPIGLIAATLGTELYLVSPRRVVRMELVDQELEWLLGKDKVKSVTPMEFVFAQERIRMRRAIRWRFVLLSLPLWAIIIFAVLMGEMLNKYGEQGAVPIVVGLVLFLILVILAMLIRAFPTKGILENRERDALANIAEEIYSHYGAEMKPNVWYRLSDDGELIEISEAEALNSKTQSFKIEQKNL